MSDIGASNRPQGFMDQFSLTAHAAASEVVELFSGSDGIAVIEKHEKNDVRFQVVVTIDASPRWSEHVHPGARTWGGIPAVTASEGRRKAQAATDALMVHGALAPLVVRHSSPSVLRSMFCESEREITLQDRQVLCYAQEHCSNCRGKSTIACNHCSASGSTPCFCGTGRETCRSCAGSGAYTDTRGNRSYCQGCAGRGYQNCSRCGGSSRNRCDGCNGHGRLNCGPCETTGVITRSYGIEVHGHQRLEGGVGKGVLASTRSRIENWINAGVPDGAPGPDAPVIWWPDGYSSNGANEDGTALRFQLKVTGAVRHAVVSGSIGDRLFDAAVVELDETGIDFLPFLEAEIMLAEVACRKAAETGDPAAVRKAVRDLPILDVVLDRAAAGDDPSALAAHASQTLRGAVGPQSIERIATGFARLTETYASTALKSEWKRNLVVPTLVAAGGGWILDEWLSTTQMRSHAIYFFAVIVAGLMVFARRKRIAISARKRLAALAGKNAILPRTASHGRIAFAMWAAWAIILSWPAIARLVH